MQRSFHLFISKLKKRAALFPYIPRTLILVWSAARGWMIAWSVVLIIQGFLPVAFVYLTKIVVNNLVDVIQAGGSWTSIQPMLVSVLLMALIMLAQELLRGFSGYINTAQSECVKDYISELTHRKSTSIDLAFFDSPDYYDRLHRALHESRHRPQSLIQSTGSLLQNGITIFAMAAVLIPYGWWLPLALFISVIPAFYVVFQYRLRMYRWRIANTQNVRRTWYYESILTFRNSAAELRSFQWGDHFRSAYQKLRRQLRDENLELTRNQGLSEFAAGTMALLITGGAMVWMIWQVIQGFYSLGDLALFYSAFNQGQNLMRTILGNMGDIYDNSLFLEDLFKFLELEPEIKEPAQPIPVPQTLVNGIRFKNISFRYPGSQRFVIQNFDLEVPAGKIAAIVGANGAGKTTLIKLLNRFYDPQEGSILIDDVNLREFNLEDLRGKITIMFQEPVQLYSTAQENISFGDLKINPDETEIRKAADAAGLGPIIEKLPQEFDTLLGKFFEGGTDLSVGEWQRIALARAFFRNAPIILLDEPTSAMDPWAEVDWLRRFRTLAKNRTAIIITHRFTTAAFADVIHVMDEGHIVESGQHEQLISGGGRYAKSWIDQMGKWFPTSPIDDQLLK